jgi:regulatory protein
LERLRRSDALTEELKASLERTGFEPGTVQRVLAHLSHRQLLNDQKTIDNLVEARTGKRAAGMEKLRSELRRKGAPEELVEQRLASVSAEAEREAMLALLRSRFESSDSRARAARFLAGRGFAEDQVEGALDEFFGTPDF